MSGPRTLESRMLAYRRWLDAAAISASVDADVVPGAAGVDMAAGREDAYTAALAVFDEFLGGDPSDFDPSRMRTAVVWNGSIEPSLESLADRGYLTRGDPVSVHEFQPAFVGATYWCVVRDRGDALPTMECFDTREAAESSAADLSARINKGSG